MQCDKSNDMTGASNIYVSTWLSPEPLLSFASFLGDNMNHISDIFITYSSSNSFIFNCCLIFHFMNKSQDSYLFLYWWHIGWSFFTNMENNGNIFPCKNIPIRPSFVHGWDFFTCIYYQVMGYTHFANWNIAKLLSKDFGPIYSPTSDTWEFSFLHICHRLVSSY